MSSYLRWFRESMRCAREGIDKRYWPHIGKCRGHWGPMNNRETLPVTFETNNMGMKLFLCSDCAEENDAAIAHEKQCQETKARIAREAQLAKERKELDRARRAAEKAVSRRFFAGRRVNWWE